MPSQFNATLRRTPWVGTVEGIRDILEEGDWSGHETVDQPEVLDIRKRLVEKFSASGFYQQHEDVQDVVDNDLATAGDVSEIDQAIESLYDLADELRWWIE